MVVLVSHRTHAARPSCASEIKQRKQVMHPSETLLQSEAKTAPNSASRQHSSTWSLHHWHIQMLARLKRLLGRARTLQAKCSWLQDTSFSKAFANRPAPVSEKRSDGRCHVAAATVASSCDTCFCWRFYGLMVRLMIV